MNTITRIEELRAAGYEDKMVRAYLTLDGYTTKEIAEAFKSLGGSKAQGFKAVYFKWLAECPRTKEEATEYILGNGEYGETSDNVKKSLSTNMNIWELSASIWDAKPVEKESEEELDERATKIKLAWEKLERAKMKTRKTKGIHPDKVSYLEDDELTKAYSDYFKNA